MALDFLFQWTPNPGQLEIGKAIFNRGCKVVFARMGRNGGKSYGGVGFAVKYALENPGSRIYYFAPLYKQVKDIVWYPKLIEEFLHPRYIERQDNQDARMFLLNGSYIKCDGSDNFDAQRGYKPDFVVADEFADFHPRWSEAMFPNLAARDATLLMMGTPPSFPVLADGKKHHYVVMDEEVRGRMKKGSDRSFWIHLPTHNNPTISPEWLKEEEERLTNRGEEYVWRREYLAEIVVGDSSAVFPMFSESKHTTEHEDLIAEIQKDPNRYEWWCGADPATRSTFGVLFMAIDRYTATPYWLDEFYEQDASFTTTNMMLPRVHKKIEELHPNLDDWNFVCDNAAASFIEESAQHPEFPVYWQPTQKQLRDKFEGINLLKDIFLGRTTLISKRCTFLSSEIINYCTDRRGKVIKERDHLIDISRYILKEMNFNFHQ